MPPPLRFSQEDGSDSNCRLSLKRLQRRPLSEDRFQAGRPYYPCQREIPELSVQGLMPSFRVAKRPISTGQIALAHCGRHPTSSVGGTGDHQDNGQSRRQKKPHHLTRCARSACGRVSAAGRRWCVGKSPLPWWWSRVAGCTAWSEPARSCRHFTAWRRLFRRALFRGDVRVHGGDGSGPPTG